MRTHVRCPVAPLGLLTALLFLDLPSASARSKAPTIVPGKSLGKISLGMSPSQVHQQLGQPDKKIKLPGGLLDDVYKSKKTRRDLNSGALVRDRIEVLYRTGRAVQLEATSPLFQTAGGLSTASGVDGLRASDYSWRLLQYSYAVGDGGWTNYYFWDGGHGLTFEFQGWQEGLLGTSRPTTLIVHRKGSRVIPDAGGVLEIESRSLQPALAN